MDTTYDIRNDLRRFLDVLLAGAEGGRPLARVAQQTHLKELAAFFRRFQEEVVEAARARLVHREADPEGETLQQEAYEGRQVEFAESAARRLEAVADRLEEESKNLGGDGKTLARAQELRVAAFMVRDEAVVVARRDVTTLASNREAREGRTPS